MQTWFESKVKYMKVSESGKENMVTENFLLDAVSFTDAESRMIKQMQEMVMSLVPAVKEASSVERFTNRYWGLEYLRRNSGEVWQGQSGSGTIPAFPPLEWVLVK